MADGGPVFTTHLGRLFGLAVTDRSAARLGDLGWFHPACRAYAPSLYSFSGRRYVFGTARREFDGSLNFEWICRDLDNKTGKALPLHLPRIRGRRGPVRLPDARPAR